MKRSMQQDAEAHERGNLRALKVKKWTRMSGLLLVGLCASAIWQERALAPPVHDGMSRVAGMAMGYIEGSEALSTVLASVQESYDEMMSDG